MSNCEVYRIEKNGDVRHYGDARNAFGGAMHIWQCFSHRYFGVSFGMEPGHNRRVWKLCDAGSPLSRAERIVLSFTFDRVWIKRECINELVEALESFWQWNHCGLPNPKRNPERWPAMLADESAQPVADTIPQLCALLRTLANEDILGVCFNQTSVNCGVYTVNTGDDEWRPLNILTDKPHGGGEFWELFDALDAQPEATPDATE